MSDAGGIKIIKHCSHAQGVDHVGEINKSTQRSGRSQASSSVNEELCECEGVIISAGRLESDGRE